MGDAPRLGPSGELQLLEIPADLAVNTFPVHPRHHEGQFSGAGVRLVAERRRRQKEQNKDEGFHALLFDRRVPFRLGFWGGRVLSINLSSRLRNCSDSSHSNAARVSSNARA